MARRVSRRPRIVHLLGFVCLAGLAACGGGSETTAPLDDPQGDDVWHEADQRRAALLQTEEFKDAAARAMACVENAGFSKEDGAIVLSDGSRYEPGARMGELLDVTYAFAEYLAVSDRCAEESGLAALEWAARPVTLRREEERFIREHNERLVTMVSCMQRQGWRFRELLTILGGRLFTEPILDPGEQDAYDLDEAECRQETASP